MMEPEQAECKSVIIHTIGAIGAHFCRLNALLQC